MVLAKIKKYYLHIAILCFSINSTLAQNFEKIQITDTLYIYFKNDNVNQIRTTNNVVNKDNHDYHFYFSDETTTIRKSYVLFNHYLISPEVIWKKKSFLKEKKDIIVDYKFLKKLGYSKSEQLLLKKKKIYIIDHDNFCKSNIKLVEAIINKVDLAPIE